MTVESVTDPVKRSEAIGGIVKSISVVDDSLLRDEYLTQLSRRLGIKQETLINSMNGMISHDREEREKEFNREQAQEAIQREKEGKPMAIGLHTTNEQIQQLEEMLIKAIVRDGEKVIYENIATADGGTVNLTVAQFVDYDLSSDGLSFSNPIYNKILQDVVSHVGEEDFKAEEYLTRHPDYEVSSVAANLAVDPYQLSKSFQMKDREGGLRQHVEHLVLDFRYYCLKEKVEELKAALKNCKDDYMSIMQELAHVDSIYKELAKKLGR